VQWKTGFLVPDLQTVMWLESVPAPYSSVMLTIFAAV